jgi:hypothetical protein
MITPPPSPPRDGCRHNHNSTTRLWSDVVAREPSVPADVPRRKSMESMVRKYILSYCLCEAVCIELPSSGLRSRQTRQYCCPGLAPNDPNRRILVSTIERELRRVQDLAGQQITSSGGSTYPHAFRNDERLPLTTSGPWDEFPLIAKGSGFHDGDDAGLVRVIYPRNPPENGARYDVVYHHVRDITKRFKKAVRRSRSAPDA